MVTLQEFNDRKQKQGVCLLRVFQVPGKCRDFVSDTTHCHVTRLKKIRKFWMSNSWVSLINFQIPFLLFTNSCLIIHCEQWWHRYSYDTVFVADMVRGRPYCEHEQHQFICWPFAGLKVMNRRLLLQSAWAIFNVWVFNFCLFINTVSLFKATCTACQQPLLLCRYVDTICFYCWRRTQCSIEEEEFLTFFTDFFRWLGQGLLRLFVDFFPLSDIEDSSFEA